MLYPTTDDVLGFQDKLTECCTAAVPEPVTDSTVGEFAALLANAKLAVVAPLACGAKVTVKGRLCPAEIVVGRDTPLTVNSGLLLLAEESVTDEPPAVSVADSFWFEPTATLPKFRLVGDTLS